MQAQLAQGRAGGAAVTFPQFLEMFRADLLDLREILAYLQLGSAAPTGRATATQASMHASWGVCTEPPCSSIGSQVGQLPERQR